MKFVEIIKCTSDYESKNEQNDLFIYFRKNNIFVFMNICRLF